MSIAQYHPEHHRTSCSDAHPINAEAGGSNGCARCTALLLDQRDELLAALREFVHEFQSGKLTETERIQKARAAIATAQSGAGEST
jgi:hypothetical protein